MVLVVNKTPVLLNQNQKLKLRALQTMLSKMVIPTWCLCFGVPFYNNLYFGIRSEAIENIKQMKDSPVETVMHHPRIK